MRFQQTLYIISRRCRIKRPTGANNLALAWGPVVGAKAIKYQVAAPLGAMCAVVGALLFGDRSAPAYGGYLKNWTVLQDLPELTIYAMLWGPLVLLIWQVLALWWQVPVVPYLGFGKMCSRSLHCTKVCCQRNAKTVPVCSATT